MKKYTLLSALLLAVLLLASVGMLVGCDQAPTQNPSETGDQSMTAQTDKNSILSYGAVGNGETDATDAIKAALAACDGGIVIPAGQYVILSDLTFDKPVTMEPGAILLPDAKATLTFEGYLDAGLMRIFGQDGNVVLKGNTTAYPEWFGARNDGKTDSTDAIQCAIDCFPNGYGRVEFMPGKYMIKRTVTVEQSHMTLSGAVRQTRELAPQIVISHTKKPALHLKGKTSGNSYDGGLEDVTIESMEFSRAQMGTVGSDTILLENTIYTTIQNCGFSLSQNGLRAVNVNGLRLYTIHATTGGDLPGEEVRGVYIDGSKRGSTGILIDDFIYYAYGSPNSITYGYKDEAKEGAVGGSTGDRRITNFECDGSCDYGIYIKSAGDFSCDIAISDFTMDGIDTSGIYLEANNAYGWQQVNITNAYFRLANGAGKAAGITAVKFANVHATGCHFDNAEGKNTGVSFKNTFNCSVQSSSFGGGDYKNLISASECEQVIFNGNMSNVGGSASFASCKNSIVTSNAMPTVSLRQSACVNCIFDKNLAK